MSSVSSRSRALGRDPVSFGGGRVRGSGEYTPRPRSFPSARRPLVQVRCGTVWSGASAGEEAEPDRPLRVVGVRVEQADRLPRPEGRAAVEHRHGQRRRGEQRQDVVGAVARRPVAMAVQRSSRGSSRSSASSRSSSEPAPTSTTTTPAVACGHEDRQQAVLGLDVGQERGTRRRSGRPRADPVGPSAPGVQDGWTDGPSAEAVASHPPTERCSGARRGCGPGRPSPAPTRSASARRRRASSRPTGAARRRCCRPG